MHLACSLWKLPSLLRCSHHHHHHHHGKTRAEPAAASRMLLEFEVEQHEQDKEEETSITPTSTSGDSVSVVSDTSSSSFSCSSSKLYYPRHYQITTKALKRQRTRGTLSVHFANETDNRIYDCPYTLLDDENVNVQWYSPEELHDIRHATQTLARAIKTGQLDTVAVRQWKQALDRAYLQSSGGGGSGGLGVDCRRHRRRQYQKHQYNNHHHDDNDQEHPCLPFSSSIETDTPMDYVGLELWTLMPLKCDRRRRKTELLHSIAYWQSLSSSSSSSCHDDDNDHDSNRIHATARHVRHVSVALSHEGRMFAAHMAQWAALQGQQDQEL